jgi:hypothetical protein
LKGYGGIYGLVERESITFDKILVRDAGNHSKYMTQLLYFIFAGIWLDSNGNKSCEDASVEGEFEFHNVGTISGTMLQWYDANTSLSAS